MLIPEVVRNKARAAGAEPWLDELPMLVAELEERWSISAGAPFTGSTESYVTEATRADGSPAVLKLLVPRDGAAAANELTVLRLADGDGCPRLFEFDIERSAMLIERLGRPLFELDLPIRQRHEILLAAASKLWRPAPGCELPTGADKAHWLADYIQFLWAELDHPCSERAVDYALECAERRRAAHDDERAVLVHGDVHQWNALEAGSGFKLVDPDGLLAEAEYDLGIIMREDPVELLQGDPHDRSHSLAAASGLDETAVWEWGVIERVSTGLLCTQIDLQPVGREMLATADVVAFS